MFKMNSIYTTYTNYMINKIQRDECSQTFWDQNIRAQIKAFHTVLPGYPLVTKRMGFKSVYLS